MWAICLAVMVSDMAYQGDTGADDLDKKSIEAILKCYREMEFRTMVYSETQLDWDSRNSREIIEEVLKELGMEPPQNNKK